MDCDDDVVLLAVCDVLVLKALEAMGKWIVRSERSRFNALGDLPYHQAHTLWRAEDAMVDKALRGAWDVVPAVLVMSPQMVPEVTRMLNSYVHDLAITGTAHSQEDLRYRYEREVSHAYAR